MKKLNEVGYEKIFKPETLALLKGKSGESLRQMLGNKNLMQTMMASSRLLPQIMEVESEYREELAEAAIDMAKQQFPIIDYACIIIDAQITDFQGVQNLENEEQSKEKIKNIETEWQEIPDYKRRRIINGVTQGGSVRGSFSFLLFREYLDLLNSDLVEQYNEILKLSFGIYDNEEAIALMLRMLSQNQKIEGGKVYVEVIKNIETEEDFSKEDNEEEQPYEEPEYQEEKPYEEEGDITLKIKARAICFPMLFHEIVKGLMEILSLQGFTGNKQQNQDVVKNVDKLQNEPDDLRYGKFIYDALSNIYNNSQYNDARIRELFFVEVYKLENEEFFSFIENAIHNKLTTQQKSWINTTLKEINDDLKNDDSDSAINNYNG